LIRIPPGGLEAEEEAEEEAEAGARVQRAASKRTVSARATTRPVVEPSGVETPGGAPEMKPKRTADSTSLVLDAAAVPSSNDTTTAQPRTVHGEPQPVVLGPRTSPC
jgi:hypothetical protein